MSKSVRLINLRSQETRWDEMGHATRHHGTSVKIHYSRTFFGEVFSSSTMNMGGETASLVLTIGTMFRLISSDKVQNRFFRVCSL